MKRGRPLRRKTPLRALHGLRRSKWGWRGPGAQAKTRAVRRPSRARQAPEPAVRVRGGREVCTDTPAGRAEYARRRELMYDRDDGMCCVCGKRITPRRIAQFEHWDGRGMDGGKRDDRTEKDGKRYNGVAHPTCNSEKGSRRLEDAKR